MINKKFVFICSGKDCKKNGCKSLQKVLKQTLKTQKLQKEIKLVKTKCLGYCKKGPNVIFQDQIYHQVSKKEIPFSLHKEVNF